MNSGAPANILYEVAHRGLEARRYGDYLPGCIGHAIGLGGHGYFSINASYSLVLIPRTIVTPIYKSPAFAQLSSRTQFDHRRARVPGDQSADNCLSGVRYLGHAIDLFSLWIGSGMRLSERTS